VVWLRVSLEDATEGRAHVDSYHGRCMVLVGEKCKTLVKRMKNYFHCH